jgi:glycosyltransferase involved in cell wall biosynthesis
MILMAGTSPETKGGVAAVINAYKHGGLFDRWRITYVRSHVDEHGKTLNKLIVAMAALAKYVSLLATNRVALVHVHSASRASFWRKSMFILPALLFRLPVIFHLHGAEFDMFYGSECGKVRQWFVRFVLNHVDRVVVLSSQWMSFIKRIAPSANVIQIFNPVTVTNTIDEVTARSSNTLVFLGQFGRRKGIFDLLAALAALKDRFPEIRLQCGGDGDIPGVVARAEELGLSDNVEVLGWVSGVAKQRVLAEGTIYVLPSYAEGLPISVLEAMEAGMPVVATTVGGIPDAIEDGMEGFLVSPGDINSLVNRISQLLQDSDLRSRMGLAAKMKVAAFFSPTSVLPQIEALYRALGVVPQDSIAMRGQPDSKTRTSQGQ